MEEGKKKTIDLAAIFKKLWPYRKKYYYVLPATLIITYLLTVCVPRYYSCTVSLAPETNGQSMSGSLGSLASTIGLGSLAKMASQDAISILIYPDVIASRDFISELMSVEVTTKKGDLKCNYYTYLRDHQSSAWWSQIISSVKEWVKPTPPDSYNGEEKISTFQLTKRQIDIFESVKSNINCNLNKKTEVISITVKDQDPLVCATIADATCKKLQEFIVAYRTHKAQVDYDYYTGLCEESKANYDEARRKYAEFADSHQDAFMVSYKSKENDLENEMQLKYNIYTAMTTQKQAAAAKLQEATPAFTTIQSASVPVKPAGPKRLFISIFMMMMSFFVLSGWLLLKKC
ncbi:MAG: chain-length determining protein [Prevotella sp.]|nr:chain-length determining protein [Prevotella sp.]